MKRACSAIVLLALSAQAIAGPRKVLVLPIDGTADAATRTKLTTSIQKLARVIDGQVQPGDITFAETAAAVGCDPATPACAETVRTTLGVDELVYGTATTQGQQVSIVVKRKVKDHPPKERSTTFTANAPSQAEPALLPLFTGAVEDLPEPEVVPEPQPEPQPQPLPEEPRPVVAARAPRTKYFGLGIAGIVGGSAVFVTGLAMWAAKSDLQDQIDRAPAGTAEEIRALQDLEGRASSRAWIGNLCVLAGLALGGYGGYLLWKDRELRSVTVAPRPVQGGGAVTISGVF